MGPALSIKPDFNKSDGAHGNTDAAHKTARVTGINRGGGYHQTKLKARTGVAVLT